MSKVAKTVRESHDIIRMELPARSPDLNPFENLWAWIKHQIDLNLRNLSRLKVRNPSTYLGFYRTRIFETLKEIYDKTQKLATQSKGFKIIY